MNYVKFLSNIAAEYTAAVLEMQLQSFVPKSLFSLPYEEFIQVDRKLNFSMSTA